MTTYATRSPLQPLHNPHMMSELRRSSRRTSANVAQKDDVLVANGGGHDAEKGRDDQKNGSGGKSVKASSQVGSSKTAGGRGKRKFEYDEEDDGFTFSRTRTKKAKPEQVKQTEATEEEQGERHKPTTTKRSRKKSVDPPIAASTENALKDNRRRSARNSGDQHTIDRNNTETPAIKVRKRSARNSGNHSNADAPAIEVKKKRAKEPKPAEQKATDDGQRTNFSTRRDPKSPKPTEHHEISWDATKISLPFADTPIIRRNKEMRKGADNRRSSLGMRGRRASSLIDSGKSNALPHDEVDSSEFYKHIEGGLPEPRRMRQLLVWCGTRALGEKPSSTSEDYHARFSAREIQQELLKDFSNKSEMSDWFSRRESTPPPRTPRPNPKNVSNLAKIEELEQQIARLLTERQTWESLLRPPPGPLLPPQPLTSDPASITATLISSPSQTALLATLLPTSIDHPSISTSPAAVTDPSTTKPQSSLTATTATRLRVATRNLEFEIDKFADNVHVLDSYIDSADELADEVLALGAAALEERDRVGRERAGAASVGVRDVLKGLSRVI